MITQTKAARRVITLLIVSIVVVCACKTTPPEPTSRSTGVPRPTRAPFPTNTPLPTVVEPGLAYGEPCKPPCWWGLIPGQATRQEAAQVVEQVRASGWAHHISGKYVVYPLPSTSTYSIMLSFDNDVLQGVEGLIGFDYSVAELIEQFGTPEGLFFWHELDDPSASKGSCSTCEGWQPPPEPELVVFAADLLYPGQGLWFTVVIPANGLGCICPEMKVEHFLYFPPTSMQEALKQDYEKRAMLSPRQPVVEVTEANLIEWHGFGPGY